VEVLLAGRVAFDESQWQRAEALPFEGGLAGRLLIEQWLNSPAQFADAANGAFGIVLFDPRDRSLHLWTDRLGVFPFYQADAGPLMLCSHPDVLADALHEEGRACDFDQTTLAEFIATGSAVQPFTYYRQIRQLEPASHYRWDLRDTPSLATQETYWQPAYATQTPAKDFKAMTEALAEAITKAVRRRTLPRLGRPVVLLSGGADSRCAVFAASEPTKVTCCTLFDEPNAELAAAQRLAAAAGASHHALRRDPDYYALNAAESVRISGGMWSVLDAHYTGAVAAIRSLQPGVILTGCYADYMFKGLLLNRRHRTFLGRNLPLYQLADFSFEFYQPHVALAADWQRCVDERLNGRFAERLRRPHEQERLLVEDLRLRPLSREPDASGRLILWRTLPWDPLLSDRDILEVYGRLSPEMKLNGIVFGKAVGKVIGPAGRRIPNNNYGTPVDASEFGRVAWFLWAVLKRKVRRLMGRETAASKLATTGSWPNWSYFVAHSPALAQLWAGPSPGERECFGDILGYDPWQVSLAEWGRRDAILFMRLVSARLWLHQRGILP
jgi:asparagine synthase (glutamine-hydrolysing)